MIYEVMKKCGLTRSESDFSIRWLGRSRQYYHVVKGEIPASALMTLMVNLEQAGEKTLAEAVLFELRNMHKKRGRTEK